MVTAVANHNTRFPPAGYQNLLEFCYRYVKGHFWVYVAQNHDLTQSANGNTVVLRVAYTFLSSDSFIVKSMRMPGSASEWDEIGRMTYTRIK